MEKKQLFRKPIRNLGQFVVAGVRTAKLDGMNGERLRDKQGGRRHPSG